MLKKVLLTFAVIFSLAVFTNAKIKAEGTYANIGTPTGSDGSPDAVSWSQGNPIMVDSYGHYIVPAQKTSNTNYNLEFSNDKGTSWSEVTGLNLEGRVSVAYDSVNDTLHAISASGSGDVVYRRYKIVRDSNYGITNFVIEPQFSSLVLDEGNTCTAVAGNPIAIVKQINGDNYLLAFWSLSKDCGVTQITQTRSAGLIITNTSSDGNGSSWFALDGSTPSGASTDANVAFNTLYSSSILNPIVQHSAMLAESGSHSNDIYYFYGDVNDTHNFTRLIFSIGDKRWLTSTTPTSFGGNIDDSHGYSLKRELLTKPVHATGQNRVYVGIARWLDNTNGDTQSLFYVDASDNVVLAGNVYSAGGAHCIYPTLDIAYDSNRNEVYTFYLTSGASNVCGHTYYKTYNGSAFSPATAFYTVSNRSVDIPVTYPTRVDNKIILFFRLNNASTPGVPPHEIYFGYVGLSGVSSSPTSKLASNATYNYDGPSSDFISSCSSFDNTWIQEFAGVGYLKLKPLFGDNFDTPNSPYTGLFSDLWGDISTWDPGSFNPNPNGTINIYSTNGAYILSNPTFTANQTFNFRAKFTQYNFEHIGIVDDSSFNRYLIFSTGNDGVLKARSSNGSESSVTIGTTYYDDFHDYKIVWNASSADFYIDGLNVATVNTNIPTGAMHIIASNNTHTAGADLLLDSISTQENLASSGSYTSCAIDTNLNSEWRQQTYITSVLPSSNLSFQVRTSDDLVSWGPWSSHLVSGSNVNQLGRFAQYKVTLGSSNPLETPEFSEPRLDFIEHLGPDAVDDNVSTDEDIPFVIHLFANDLHTDNLDSNQTILTSGALHGVADLVDAPNGGVFYTPNTGYSGADEFGYQICDNYGVCDSALVSITVNPVYVGPTAQPETSSVSNNSSVEINVLTNDIDSDGSLNPASVTITSAPSHGSANVNTSTGKITYTPNSGYVGTDSFTYNVCDNHSLCSSALVNITVNQATIENNSSPVQNQDEDLSSNILSCTDAKPALASILSATAVANSLLVTFKAGLGTFTGYEIQITTTSGDYTNSPIISLDKAMTEYSFNNLNSNLVYLLRIREKNGCTNGEWSSEFKATLATIEPISYTYSLDTLSESANNTESVSSTAPLLTIGFIALSATTIAIVLIKRRKPSDEVKWE